MNRSRLEIALGPLLFNWPAERIAEFYRRIAEEAPVDRVYLGEVVCGKRSPLTEHALAEAAERLEAAGKTVIWSTLALPAARRDRSATEKLAGDEDALVELNDMGGLYHRKNRPFVAGPFLNVYNEAAALELMGRGCVRLCPPVELSLADVRTISGAAPGLEIELWAFGRLPLAVSGRCYHARRAGLHRDACQFVCDRDPDGMEVRTLDGRPFLAINGMQTLSHGFHAAALSPKVFADAGVSALRLSPHTVDMVAVAKGFRALADREVTPGELLETLSELDLPGALVGGYLSGAAGIAPASAAAASVPA